MTLMQKIKLVKIVAYVSVAVSYGIATLMIPVVAMDAAYGVTKVWPIALLMGMLQLKFGHDALVKARQMSQYERVGRAVLSDDPNMTEDELAYAIIRSTSPEYRGTME